MGDPFCSGIESIIWIFELPLQWGVLIDTKESLVKMHLGTILYKINNCIKK